VPIKIRLESNGLYSAEASPPDTDHEWSTSKPLTVGELINELYAIGAHQTDMETPSTLLILTGFRGSPKHHFGSFG